MSQEYRYTREHEWAKLEGDMVRVGITDYAQKELGDVVYADSPKIGAELKQGDVILTVESVKAVSEVYAPVSGTVVEANLNLVKSPELINSSPEDEGWLAVLKVGDKAELERLMSEAEYNTFVAEISK